MLGEHYKPIVLFFFFAFLDEDLAKEASRKAIGIFKKRQPEIRGEEAIEASNVVLIQVCLEVWKKLTKKSNGLSSTGVAQSPNWKIPSKLNLSTWRQFLKEADSDEYLLVIWSQVLGASTSCLAEAFGVTQGTVTYRLGKGVHKLGSFAGEGMANA